MSRLLLVPILLMCIFCASFAAFAWWGLRHTPVRTVTQAERNHAISADIPAQRHLADCYRDGCVDHRRSPLLGCAWRLVIVEETHRAEDLSEAAKDCGELAEKDRAAAERARDTLLKQVHELGKAHL